MSPTHPHVAPTPDGSEVVIAPRPPGRSNRLERGLIEKATAA